MTIPALRRHTSRLNRSQPTISLGIKNSQIVMILLAVIPSENVQFIFEQCGRMIFYLRCLNDNSVIVDLVNYNVLLWWPQIV